MYENAENVTLSVSGVKSTYSTKMLERSWDTLPDHVFVTILSYLTLGDRYHASLVCKAWNLCFQMPFLWKTITFRFNEPSQGRLLKSLDMYGQYFRSVCVEVDQGNSENRDHACNLLSGLAGLTARRLTHFKIRFIGENPYFYAGHEFIVAIRKILGPVEDNVETIQHIRNIDLSGLAVAYDDALIDVISQNQPCIEKLNILNKVLVCKVTPSCILRLIIKCRKLKELCLFHLCVSDDVLLALAEDDRHPLEYLFMVCRREEKYQKDTSGTVWAALSTKLPGLRVGLAFDHTCPLHRVSDVMQPEIPVTELRLETFTYIYDEVRQAARYYGGTLTKMVLQTPLSRNSPELNRSLIELIQACPKLESLHVFCVLDKSTVDTILALRPILAEKGTYTLKHTAEPHPWVAGNDCY